MRIFPLALAASAALATAPAPATAASRNFWDDASTVGDAALVAGALGLPAVRGDGRGALQAAGSIGAAFAATQLLKETFPELRPDGSDRRSFPSGHTSVSFAAAATIHRREGWQVGVPATLLAGFVGFARVRADKHHWHDVIVGAAIGEASGLLITTPRNSNVAFFPWADTQQAGVTVAMRF
jgi:membrane-associated phospholipid phosphatase